MGYVPLLLDVVVFGSLALLGVGYFLPSNNRHFWRAAGFIGFGAFWGVRSALFADEGADAVNITFTALALPFFAYLAWHEVWSQQRDEEVPALKWAAGATFLGGMLYFSVDRIEWVASGLIQVVAYQTIWLMNLFGYGYGFTVSGVGRDPITGELGAPIDGSGVIIILGCTSFEAIVIFLGAIFAAQMRKDPWADYAEVDDEKVARLRAMTPERRRWLGLLYTIPVIWVLNLVRNASVIYLFNSHALDGPAASLGMSGFDFAHALLGKGLSFIALIVIAFVLFKTCPEILDMVNGLMDLPRRGKQRGNGGAGGAKVESEEKPPAAAADAAAAE